MSITFRQVAPWTLVAVMVLSGAHDRTPTTASSTEPLEPPTVAFTVEAATFASGGQGCWEGPFYCGGAYYDETPGNWGDAQVRPGTDIDLWYDDGGIVIGGLDGLEWVTFAVNVPQSGQYTVAFRTASPIDRPDGSGVINVGIHGVDGSWLGNQTVPVTGGAGEWHHYETWQAPTTIYLPAGPQALTMWAAGGWYNVRNITFTLQTSDPAPDLIIPGQVNPMLLSGFVRDQSGTPVSGARIIFRYCASTLCNNLPLVLFTDDAGHYEARFDAVPGYDGSIGWAWVEKDVWFGYEVDNRFVRVTTRHATYNFILREIEWIPAEGSTDVTVSVNDPLCFNDAQDPSFGSRTICHPVRVLAPSDGTLRIEMVPTGPLTAAIGLEIDVSGKGSVHCCEASGSHDIAVRAGEQVFVSPQVGPGETQSFRIFTSMSIGQK